jgi:hypothetical protein
MTTAGESSIFSRKHAAVITNASAIIRPHLDAADRSFRIFRVHDVVAWLRVMAFSTGGHLGPDTAKLPRKLSCSSINSLPTSLLWRLARQIAALKRRLADLCFKPGRFVFENLDPQPSVSLQLAKSLCALVFLGHGLA